MKSSYFNIHEFNHARDLMSVDPFTAKAKFEDYIKKYPQDYVARSYYASTLISLQELEMAKEVLEDLEFKLFNDKQFINIKDQSMLQYINRSITYSRVKLLFYGNKFEELYNTYFKDDNLYNEECDSFDYLNHVDMGYFNYNATLFYIRKQLGLLSPDMVLHTYLFKQILNYNEELFREHVERHMADYNIDKDVPNSSIFKADIPMDEIIAEVKRTLLPQNAIYYGLLQDAYIFRYDSCGWDNNKMVDYFKVECFHDTDEIITMCPSLNCKYMPFVDLNYMNINTSDSTKVKKRSKVDIFNQRYGIK